MAAITPPLENQQLVTARLPLVLTEYARDISAASGSSTSSGIVGVGVVGIMVVGLLTASTKDQRMVNAIPTKITNSMTGAQTFYVSKRPGFATLNTPSAGNPGSAIHVWAGQGSGTSVISAFGATNSTVYNGTSSLGSTTGKVYFIEDTLVGTTPNLTFVTDSNTAYFYPEGGALTQITDVDYPGNVAGQTTTGGFVFLDGYAFIMTGSGRVYNSDLNSMANWTASSYISCNMSPDKGVGLARYKDQIVAFGKQSTEFFQDVGNPTGSPLQRTPQGFMNIGCVSQHTYDIMDDTIMWLGSTDRSGVALYMLEGLQAKRLSTPTIETLLATTNPDNLTLSCIKVVGKSLVVIASTSDLRTYVYCVEDDMWHEWNGAAQLWQHMHGIGSGIKYVYAVTEQNTTGKVYLINPTSFSFQDDSMNYTMLLQTSRFDVGNQKLKICRKLRLIGDIQDSTATVDVSWSDDDYRTTSSGRSVDMSVDDAYLNGCGSFRRRSFSLSYTGSQPMRLEAIEIDYAQGIH